MMTILAAVGLLLAAIPAYFYFRNVGVFGRLDAAPPDHEAAVSILIPARDEQANIAACIEMALASGGDQVEVVVLDDHSQDATPEIVADFASRDSRVRLLSGAPLPDGWNGKQHACWQLAEAARHELLLFLDADVRLHRDAAPRIAARMAQPGADLLSGFPEQQTGSFLERLLIPLIHFVLLGFLSLRQMRRARNPSFAAGCGQLFATTREAYRRSGGHAAIRASRHDGIKLPRLYLQEGLTIDVFDATDLATVRMYHGAGATWRGLAKNADEGVASPGLIVPVTALLLGGQVAPVAILMAAWAMGLGIGTLGLAAAGTALALAPRLDAAWRFHQPVLGALLHPLGVLVFLAIQWSALFASITGRKVEWKGRPATAP